jgi:hypothetical protein
MAGGDRLWRIKILRAPIWVVLVGAILAIPVIASAGDLHLALRLSVAVSAEVFVLAVNGMRGPLTDVAARYTTDRSDNFDILPIWLVRHNKLIFGSLFAATEVFLVREWLVRSDMQRAAARAAFMTAGGRSRARAAVSTAAPRR